MNTEINELRHMKTKKYMGINVANGFNNTMNKKKSEKNSIGELETY